MTKHHAAGSPASETGPPTPNVSVDGHGDSLNTSLLSLPSVYFRDASIFEDLEEDPGVTSDNVSLEKLHGDEQKFEDFDLSLSFGKDTIHTLVQVGIHATGYTLALVLSHFALAHLDGPKHSPEAEKVIIVPARPYPFLSDPGIAECPSELTPIKNVKGKEANPNTPSSGGPRKLDRC